MMDEEVILCCDNCGDIYLDWESNYDNEVVHLCGECEYLRLTNQLQEGDYEDIS